MFPTIHIQRVTGRREIMGIHEPCQLGIITGIDERQLRRVAQQAKSQWFDLYLFFDPIIIGSERRSHMNANSVRFEAWL